MEISDPGKIARIEALAIPPAWKEVWISPWPGAKLQATGIDAAGRRQYLYSPNFRARQEQAKFDKLIRFADRLPQLRTAMAEHMSHGELDREKVCAVAVALINHGWFRVGSERYARAYKTFGITTLTRRHVEVKGSRILFTFRAKHRILNRTAIVDQELADLVKELLALPGGRRLFRYRQDEEVLNLTGARLNEYLREHLGEEFTAKDFRTWGGTLEAALALARRRLPETESQTKREIAAVMRTVGERLGNTPAVARASYVSPAVVEQYRDGRTIENVRPRRLRAVGARELDLNAEEEALLTLLRSWHIRRTRQAA